MKMGFQPVLPSKVPHLSGICSTKPWVKSTDGVIFVFPGTVWESQRSRRWEYLWSDKYGEGGKRTNPLKGTRECPGPMTRFQIWLLASNLVMVRGKQRPWKMLESQWSESSICRKSYLATSNRSQPAAPFEVQIAWCGKGHLTNDVVTGDLFWHWLRNPRLSNKPSTS